MSIYLGTSLCHIEILQQRRDSQLGVELRVPDNKKFYAFLLQHRDEVDAAVGEELQWLELPEQKASRVLALRDVQYGSVKDQPSQFRWAMDVALGFK